MKHKFAWRRFDPVTEAAGAPTTRREAQTQVDAWGGVVQRVGRRVPRS
jgi:hypothetical protein